MDAHLLGKECLSPLICGEESFGTGSSHVREKDGLWAVLCWLSILAHHNQDTPAGQLVGVGDIVRQHWRTYGRNFYTRYDYEQVESDRAKLMVDRLLVIGQAFTADGYGASKSMEMGQGFSLSCIDEFTYTDPIDGSVSTNQGIRLLFTDGSRIIFRLSGTGSVGATVRMYIEKYVPPTDGEEALEMDVAEALDPLVGIALEFAQVRELLGRDEPTVIT
uniref:Alpha-D-phosphohexomutase alpha/beta/alpha domain-containing protein n=1 Tax=Haptolina ericina TaxID=156174 RepID=A0A7S3AFU7_9EUKA